MRGNRGPYRSYQQSRNEMALWSTFDSGMYVHPVNAQLVISRYLTISGNHVGPGGEPIDRL